MLLGWLCFEVFLVWGVGFFILFWFFFVVVVVWGGWVEILILMFGVFLKYFEILTMNFKEMWCEQVAINPVMASFTISLADT